MEDGIYNTRGVIQTNSDVFWPNELTGNIPDHDE